MQTFWQQETDRRAGLFLLLIPALTICLLTGSAYGSGLVGSSLADTDGMPLPARKPAALHLASLPQDQDKADTSGMPLPARKPQPPAAARPDVVALLNFGLPAAEKPPTEKPAAKTASLKMPTVPPRPPRKPQRAPETPMPAADADVYKQIFDLQTAADWKEADKLLPRLAEDHLRGHILYQRYMHPSYKTKFDELESWLARYADLPGADRIYRLAESRKPSSYKGTLHRPAARGGILGHLPILDDTSATYSAGHKRTSAQKSAVATLTRAIRKDVSAGAPAKAMKHLESSLAAAYLDEVERDQLRAHIAGGYLYGGKLKKSYEIAAAAAKRSGTNVPMAGWNGGLAAWRLGKYKESAALFELVATSPFTSSWMSSAGAFWASRAHMRAGNTRAVSPWLRQAAAHPRTFYGLIATRALGWDFDFNWDMPQLTPEHRARLDAEPAARRAIALVAAGQHHLAEHELRRLNPKGDPALRQALLAYAHDARLPGLSMRLAESTAGPDGTLYDSALYPLAPWEPASGFEVDRALIHAIIRQESRFDPGAQNASGATGLMQLMPATASFVAGTRKYREQEGRHSLKDPATNLAIGQRYIADLLAQDAVKTDLFSLAIAYNAGPGKLRRWKSELADTVDDPLLFIESIPVGETRAFVERVLANYWIYRLRLNQKTPSLDAVAAGRGARYVSLDKDTVPRRQPLRLASN